MALFSGLQYSGIFSIVAPLFITFCQMFGRRCAPSARPSLLMFRTDHPIIRISSSLVLYRVPRSGSSLWRRDRNCMDSYQVTTVDVPESPIASGARGQWEQQRRDSLHCHEEWLCSIPCVVVFSWELDKGGAAGSCSVYRLPWRYSVVQYYPINVKCQIEQHNV